MQEAVGFFERHEARVERYLTGADREAVLKEEREDKAKMEERAMFLLGYDMQAVQTVLGQAHQRVAARSAAQEIVRPAPTLLVPRSSRKQ
jgi:hypothetical protein